MKALRILLPVLMLVASATTAMGANVTISGPGMSGTYSLSNMNISSNGDITLTVSGGGGGGCTSSSASISPSSITIPITAGATAAAQSVSIVDNCNTPLPYTASVSVTNGSNWITVPTQGTGPMSITLNTPGLAAGSYQAIITVNPAGFQSGNINLTLTVNSSGGVGGGTGAAGTATNIGARYPNTYLGSIAPNGENHYYFTLDKNQYLVEIDMLSADWKTNQDLIVSPSQQPKCSDITASWASGPTFWYGPVPTSNETVTISPNVKAGTTIYVTVCNRSAAAGLFKLSWD